jgi:hypothetical protein
MRSSSSREIVANSGAVSASASSNRAAVSRRGRAMSASVTRV